MSGTSARITIPTDKIYAVIELHGKDDGKPYAVPVPSCWLFDVSVDEVNGKIVKPGLCYWPRDEMKLSDWVERRKKPDSLNTDHWTVYSVTVLKLCRSFRDAKEQSAVALSKSDISESDVGNKDQNNKRSRKPSRKFDPSVNRKTSEESFSDQSSISSESSDSENDLQGRPIKAFKISGTDNRSSNISSEDKAKDVTAVSSDELLGSSSSTLQLPSKTPDQSMHQEFSPSMQKPRNSGEPMETTPAESASGNNLRGLWFGGEKTVPCSSNNKSPHDTPAGQKTPLTTVNVCASACSSGHNSLRSVRSGLNSPEEGISHKGKSATPRKSLFQSPRKASVGAKSPVHKENVGHRTFMREMAGIHKRLDFITARLDKLMIYCCPQLELSGINKDTERNIPILPIQNEKAEEEWDKFLSDGNNAACAINLLADHGCNDLKESVYSILRKLYSNKHACGYNFEGKHRAGVQIKKKAFKCTKSYTIMLAAVKKHNEKLEKTKSNFVYEVNTVHAHIMHWLRDAPSRYKNGLKSQKLQENHQQEGNEVP